MAKTCPKCGLLSPEESTRCECGFAWKEVGEPPKPQAMDLTSEAVRVGAASPKWISSNAVEVGALINQLKAADVADRCAAALALGEPGVKRPRVGDPLLECFSDQDPAVHAAAYVALGAYPSPSVLDHC